MRKWKERSRKREYEGVYTDKMRGKRNKWEGLDYVREERKGS